MTTRHAFDRWLFGLFPQTPETLALIRVAFAGFFLTFGMQSFTWIGANPDAFFVAPRLSLGRFFDTFPPTWILRVLSAAIGVLYIFLLLGFKTRTTSVLLTVLLILGHTFRYSFGKIDHNILPVVAPLVMSFSNWGAALSIDARLRRTHAPREVHSWPLTVMATLVAFGFLSSGWPKALAWMNFDLHTQGVRHWVINNYFNIGRRELLAPLVVRIDNAYFWETMDIVAVVFEVSAVFAIFRRELFRAWLLMATIFHLLNFLILNIPFTTNLAVYMVFMPWEPVVAYLRRTNGRARLQRMMSLRWLAGLTVVYLPFYLFPASQMEIRTVVDNFCIAAVVVNGILGLPFYIPGNLIILSLGVAVALAVATHSLSGVEDDSSGEPSVVYFDGVCNLCNGFIDFVIRRDKRQRYRYASLQSAHGQRTVRKHDIPLGNEATIVLVQNDRAFVRSTAVLRIVAGLGGLWALAGWLRIIPPPVRNLIYRLVAKNRYRVFGMRDTCRVPSREERAMFVED